MKVRTMPQSSIQRDPKAKPADTEGLVVRFGGPELQAGRGAKWVRSLRRKRLCFLRVWIQKWVRLVNSLSVPENRSRRVMKATKPPTEMPGASGESYSNRVV